MKGRLKGRILHHVNENKGLIRLPMAQVEQLSSDRRVPFPPAGHLWLNLTPGLDQDSDGSLPIEWPDLGPLLDLLDKP